MPGANNQTAMIAAIRTAGGIKRRDRRIAGTMTSARSFEKGMPRLIGDASSRCVIPAGVNIDPGLTPTSPGLSAPRGGEGRCGGATSLLAALGGGEGRGGGATSFLSAPRGGKGRYGGATSFLAAPR